MAETTIGPDCYVTVEGNGVKWECRLLTFDGVNDRYTPLTLSRHSSETEAYDAAIKAATNRGLEVRL